MTTQYWLVKQEPEKYSWEDFVKDRRTDWDGVRNYQARNNLKSMAAGDRVLFYASVTGKVVRGVATVSKTAYPDPTTDDDRWVAVQLKPQVELPHPVSLEQIKGTPALAEIALLKQSRLSVMPLRKPEFDRILKMGGLAPGS
ncbi:EVE domain-containing protein [Synoicihabitans lomoniglobus]|uniref:EVE domain-containing protein n=1 Tax=Synoicihabitans lomoniglobus TaxID=2909285 RepID=A0AAF0CMN6_9BACT|nr:EVE domain-containing protein [Opitutaceae bacterium LMO-M01]WED63290.1 EVE domain-containing protein [Opitutaceae bacterium LMO-M01]